MLRPESSEQIALFDWIRLKPDLSKYAFSIPNESKRNPITGHIMKRMGMRSGVSDLFIAIPTAPYHGLFIELKAGKNKATPSQLEFIKDMRSQGYCAEVCVGAEAAIKLIMDYLKSQRVAPSSDKGIE